MNKWFQNKLRLFPYFKGKHRLSRLLLTEDYRESARDIHIFGHYRCQYILPHIIEYSYWEVFYNGIYEPNTLKYLNTHLPQNGCFIDVGANIGLISIPLAKLRPDVSIYAIEADPHIFSYLNQNIQLNQLDNIKALNCPIHAESGLELPFFAPKDKMGCGSFTPLFTQEATMLVTKTLDKIVEEEQIPKVDLIKMDIEGYEYYAIKGAQGLLKRDTPLILFEFVDWAEAQAKGLEKGSCQNLFLSLGYQLSVLEGYKVEKLSTPMIEGSAMLIAQHNKLFS